MVGVHAAVKKPEGVFLRCTVDGLDIARCLELPAWMFERAYCPDDLRLTAVPFVGIDALVALSALLDQALRTSAASSNAPLSGASSSSHDQNRGEAHAIDGGDEGEQVQTTETAPAQADGAVRKRQAGARLRAPVAGVAGGSAVGADGTDGPVDPQSRGQGRTPSREGGQP
jgi:hypothetical protein